MIFMVVSYAKLHKVQSFDGNLGELGSSYSSQPFQAATSLAQDDCLCRLKYEPVSQWSYILTYFCSAASTGKENW